MNQLFHSLNALHVAAAASALTLLVGLLLTLQASSLRPVRPQGLRSGFTRRTLAMELLKCVGDVGDVLGPGQWNRNIMVWQQWIDFFFIAFYLLAFLAFALAAGRRNQAWGMGIGCLAVVAAGADLIEDLSIMAIAGADTVTTQQINRVRRAALTKWCCIFVLLGTLSPLYWLLATPAANVAAVLLFTAGLFGMAVTFTSKAPLIEKATSLMSLALLCATLVLIGLAIRRELPAW